MLIYSAGQGLRTCDTFVFHHFLHFMISYLLSHTPGLEAIKLFSCSTQLSMKFSLLINMKMPTIIGIFVFISREMFMSAMFSKKEFGVISKLRFINLRFISMKNFKLS